jgi:hypothetical protein
MGNLAAAFALGYLSQFYYFLIMALVAGLATISFIFVRMPVKKFRKMSFSGRRTSIIFTHEKAN